MGLTGSKLGCGEGGCGACTVLISQYVAHHIEHRTVNACLAPICSVDGCHVVTIEGLGSVSKSNLHPTQSRLAELSGSQCGFCTPGIVMSLYGTITRSDKSSSLTMHDIEDALDGNLCRCTGYRPILDAAKSFACDIDKLPCRTASTTKTTSTSLDKCLLFPKDNTSPTNQIEFPHQLHEYIPRSLHIKGTRFFCFRIYSYRTICLGSTVEWYRPVTLSELLHLRHIYPGTASKLVFGNTEVQIETKFKRIQYPRLISITHVPELKTLKRTETSLIIGAGVTLSCLQSTLVEWNKNSKESDDGGICQAMIDQLKYFASTQIRNVDSFGGNIINASPM